MDKIKIGLYLPINVIVRLRQESAQKFISQSYIVEEALRKYLTEDINEKRT